jgi:hypothetical protein
MKRLLSLAGAVALAVAGGVQAATFHAFVGTGDTATTTKTYGIGNTILLGQPTPPLGALISQSAKATSGMVGGFDARGHAGVVEASGGLNDQAVAGMQGYLHTRVGVNVALPYGFQVTPGFALGYTAGMTGAGGNINRVRLTPALSIAYQNRVHLTYRQSPWSLGAGNHAPRDILVRVTKRGMGVLTIGTVIPDTRNAVSKGVVVALKTPRLDGFGVRVIYVGGLQGNAPSGPYNPRRPWDSYSRGVTVGAFYHFHKGVTVGICEGSQNNAYGSETSTQITQTTKTGHDAGVTLSDRF